MSKYINADELNAKIYEEYDPSDDDYVHIGIGIVQDLLNDMPSADVVEVVRCQDCEYGIENGEWCGRKVYLCSAMTNPNEFYGDFYCESGERKDNE